MFYFIAHLEFSINIANNHENKVSINNIMRSSHFLMSFCLGEYLSFNKISSLFNKWLNFWFSLLWICLKPIMNKYNEVTQQDTKFNQLQKSNKKPLLLNYTLCVYWWNRAEKVGTKFNSNFFITGGQATKPEEVLLHDLTIFG